MRTTMMLGTIALFGLSGCGGEKGTRKIGADASQAYNEVGGQAGAADSRGSTGGIDGAVDSPAVDSEVADVGVPTGDAFIGGIDAAAACPAAATDAAQAESSVAEVLAGADSLVCALLSVPGKVFGDLRQKPGDWPAPALSLFILQDGGDLPGYATSAPRPFIQLYASPDLAPYLGQQVHVVGYLRSIVIVDVNGQSSPFLYLEVVTISADGNGDADAGPDVSGSPDGPGCQPLAYSGGDSSFNGSRYCPVDPSLPECKSDDQGAVVYRDEACATATRKAHPDCDGWQKDSRSEVVILTDPFEGCDWPISVDSVFDCGDHVSVAYSVVEPCGTCDGIAPLSIAISLPNDAKPVRATPTLKHPTTCP